jgi:hypothetical protein
MRNLIIIGPDFDEVADMMSRGRSWTVRRCSNPQELIAAFEELPDGQLERVDILDHGGEGYINLGEWVLFRSDDNSHNALEGAGVAERMRPKLTSAAQLRLLGCNTGATAFKRPVGRHLVLKLAGLLNPADDLGSNRIAFVTIAEVRRDHFTPEGLDRQQELALLYSSYGALDCACPTHLRRSENITDLRAVIPIS